MRAVALEVLALRVPRVAPENAVARTSGITKAIYGNQKTCDKPKQLLYWANLEEVEIHVHHVADDGRGNGEREH